MTDDLLRRLQNGEPDAQRELFEYCNARLRPFLLPKLPNVRDLDDCVSEVFTRALEGIDFGPRPRVLEPWLFGIAKNVLKELYRAKNLSAGEVPDDLPEPSVEPPVELDRTDLPDRLSDFEMRQGKRELWDTLIAATSCLSSGLASIMRTYMELTLRRNHLVVGKELAEALGQPVDIVSRQLNRGKSKMLDVLVPLQLARTGHSACPALAGLLRESLRPDQPRAGRKLELDPTQASTVLKHANECAACAPQVDEARDFGRWALGPGLVGLADDDEERRRAIIAALDRAGEGQLAAQSSTAAALTAIPAPLAAAQAPAGIVERVRTAVATRVATLPRPDGVVRFAQENPEVFRRVLTSVGSGVVVVAAIIGLLASDHTGRPEAAPTRPPTPIPTSPSATPPAGPPTTTTPAPASPAPASTTIAPPSPIVAAPPRSEPPAPTAVPPATQQEPPPASDAPPPPPMADTVDIDARDLDYPVFAISGVAGFLNTKEIQHLRLSPGPYSLTTSVGHKLTFQVTDDRHVEYDRTLEGTFTGGGSSTLAVHGSPITLDATDVDHASTGVRGVYQTNNRRHTYKLLPGRASLVINNGASYGFSVTSDGHVVYDPGLRGRLTGSGSPMLALHGSPVELDVSDVDYSHTGVSGTFVTTDRRHTYKLLPGLYYLVFNNQASYHFTITTDGHVRYDPALQGALTGSGSTTLAIHGFPVTFDATDADYTGIGIGGIVTYTNGRHTYRLLPGGHYLVFNNQVSYLFTITTDGHVRYDPALQGALTGSGSTTLAVHGFPVTFDATEWGENSFAIAGVGLWDARRQQTLRLLPGSHLMAFPSGKRIVFRVTDAGRVDYDHSLDDVLLGRGDATLIVRRPRG